MTLKVPLESSLAAIFNFKSHKTLRDVYGNPEGSRIRISKLVEDLDGFAGRVALDHCKSHNYMLTRSVHKINFCRPLPLNEDLELRAGVAWTGKASVKVRLCGFQADQPSVAGWFTFVAVDPSTMQPTAVRIGVHPGNEQEEEMVFAFAANQPRLEFAADEATLILQEVVKCDPRTDNRQQGVYGGFLMRQAWDRACLAAHLVHGDVEPHRLELSYGEFRKRVKPGDLLELRCLAISGAGNDMKTQMIKVEACVGKEVTNRFIFTLKGVLDDGIVGDLSDVMVRAARTLQVSDCSLLELLKTK